MKWLLLTTGLLVTETALAAGTTYQDWWAGPNDGGSYAAAVTVNTSGDGLGEFCYKNDHHCEWRFSVKNFGCTPKHESEVLVNAKTGVNAVVVVCVGALMDDDPNTYTFKIKNWQYFESVLKDNAEVGIAIPGQDTTFRVVRFSLRGMNTAIAKIGGAIEDPKNTPARNDDVTL